MNQTWRLYNIDEREMIENTPPKSGALGLFFFQDSLGYLLRTLRLPCLPKEFDKWLKQGRVAHQPRPFGKLPTEIIDMIFSLLSIHWLQAIFLSITCKHLFAIGEQHIVTELGALYARWSYSRIICLGDYAGNRDMPDDLFYPEEQEQIDAAKPKGFLTSFANFAYEAYAPHLTMPYTITSDAQSMIRHTAPGSTEEDAKSRAERRVLVNDKEMLKAIMGTFDGELTYPDEPIALYNMSKGEYVREDALSAAKLEYTPLGSDQDSKKCSMGLAHAFLSRICWTVCLAENEIICAEKYRKRLTNGAWVGDWCCVKTVAELPKMRLRKGVKEWKDVTKETDRLLRHLWKHNVAKGQLGELWENPDIVQRQLEESEDEEDDKGEDGQDARDVEVLKGQGAGAGNKVE